MSKFEVKQQPQAGKKCTACRKPIEALSIGTTTVSMGVEGVTMWRHAQCCDRGQVKQIMLDIEENLDGFKDLPEDDQETITKEFTKLSQEEPKKRKPAAAAAAGTKKKAGTAKKPAAKKAKKSKDADDSDSAEEEDKEDKPKKARKTKVEGEPKKPATSPSLKDEYPDLSPSELVKKMGEEWKEMSDEQKKTYIAKAEAAAALYKQQKEQFDKTGTYDGKDEIEAADKKKKEDAKAASKAKGKSKKAAPAAKKTKNDDAEGPTEDAEEPEEPEAEEEEKAKADSSESSASDDE